MFLEVGFAFVTKSFSTFHREIHYTEHVAGVIVIIVNNLHQRSDSAKEPG